MTLIKDINNILEYGKKMTSYKYATLLAIFDYITENPIEPPINNFHFIPIIYLAKQFVLYYYPFSFYEYYQGSLAPNKKLKIYNHIDKFRLDISNNSDISIDILKKIQTLKESGIFWINRLFELSEPLPDYLNNMISNVRTLILNQPLRYLHNVNGEIIRFFGILNKEISFKASYEDHLNQALK